MQMKMKMQMKINSGIKKIIKEIKMKMGIRRRKNIMEMIYLLELVFLF